MKLITESLALKITDFLNKNSDQYVAIFICNSHQKITKNI